MPGRIYEGATQRVGVLAQLPALLREIGVDPQKVFEQSGIGLDDLTPESRIPFKAVMMLLDSAAQVTGFSHVGLLLGSRHSVAAHGPIGRLMRHAPTLHQALLDFVTWQIGYSSAATVYLNRMGSDFAFGYGIYDFQFNGLRQTYDVAMAFGLTLLSDLTDGKVRPTEVLYSLRAPEDLSPYKKYFKVKINFDQEQTCMVLDREAIETPMPAANEVEYQRARAELGAMRNAQSSQISAQARHCMRPLLHKGTPTMVSTADSLGIHPRTLRRKLAAEGIKFETIRDEVRFAMATELLDMTNLPVGMIALAVAFANHAAFIRAFRRWSGMTPTQWRARRTPAVAA